jgi:hypothetical protein
METSMATSKLTGNKTPEASDRTQALISTAPGEEWYWILTYVSDGNYVTTFVVMDVQITYDVEFFDRNEIDRSSLAGQQAEALYEQLYQLRVKALTEAKRPHNTQIPWNRAKQETKMLVENIESKGDSALSEEAHLRELQKNMQDIEDYQKLHANVPTLRSVQDRWLKVEVGANPTPRTKAISLK